MSEHPLAAERQPPPISRWRVARAGGVGAACGLIMAEGLFGPESIFHKSASELIPFFISVTIMVFIGFAVLEPFLAWLQHGQSEECPSPTRRQTLARRFIGFAIVVFLTLLLTVFEDLHRETLVHKNLITGWLVAMCVAWGVTYFWVLGAQHGRMRATIYGTLASLGIGIISTGLIVASVVLINLQHLLSNEQALRGFLANMPAMIWLLMVSNIGGWVLCGLLGGLAIDFGRGVPVCFRLFVALVIAGAAITISNWPIADDNTGLFRDLIRSSGWGLALLLYPAANSSLERLRKTPPPWYMSVAAVAIGFAALVAITTISWATAYVQRARFYDAIISFGPHDGPIAEVLPLHDGELVTMSRGRDGVSPETGDLTVRVWRIEERSGETHAREHRRLFAYNMPASTSQPATPPNQMALLDLHMPTGEQELLWTLSADGYVTAWDRDRAIPLGRGKLQLPPRTFANPQSFYARLLAAESMRIVAGCITHDGKTALVADNLGRVHEFELGKVAPGSSADLFSFATHLPGGGSVTAIRCSDNTAHIAVGSANGLVTVIERATKKVRVLDRQTPVNTTRVNSLAWSHDHSTLAAAMENGDVMVWEVSSGVHRLRLRGHEAPATGVAFTPDCKHLASTSMNPERAFVVWDCISGEAIFGGRHIGGATCLTIYAGGTRAATGSQQGMVTLWRIPRF